MDGKATNCLAIMRQWQWLRCDPDGNEFPPGMSVSSIVSRLAFDGLRRPQAAILELLCQGSLLSRGYIKWRKYQDFDHYGDEDYAHQIATRHWQNLADSIENARRGRSDSHFETTLKLSELGLGECAAHCWDYGRSSFQYAVVRDDDEPWSDDYMEEWFSAWDIEAWPAFLHEQDRGEGEHESAGSPDVPTARRGRPAANWWPDFAEELALYIHDEGIPDGSGHDGQSAIIDAIFARLAAAGKVEPSRATVQPVVNAVLSRIRSAGK